MKAYHVKIRLGLFEVDLYTMNIDPPDESSFGIIVYESVHAGRITYIKDC
jgi:hypothetical protein